MRPKPLFPAAHVITTLTTKAPVQHQTDAWHEPHGALQSVVWQDPDCPGVLLHARLGASGLQLLRLHSPKSEHPDNVAVCIPLDALFALAHEINPRFKAPPNGTARSPGFGPSQQSPDGINPGLQTDAALSDL